MLSVVDGCEDVLLILVVEFDGFEDGRFESTVARLNPHRDALQEVERRRLPNFQVPHLRKLVVSFREETFLKRK